MPPCLKPSILTSVSDLTTGCRAKIVGYKPGSPTLRHKLLAMGLTPGVQFEVVRVAPMGCPIQLSVRGYDLSLRRDETALLQIESV